jgi:enamine deaminase RidA (YjgF/YER057c/UK114 family)
MLDKQNPNLPRIDKVTTPPPGTTVNSIRSITEQHLVANGASDLLCELFDERGKHARSAFGVAQIPLGCCVEIDLVLDVE